MLATIFMNPKLLYQLFIFIFLLISCSQRNTKEKLNSAVKDSVAKVSAMKVFIPVPTLEDSCICDSSAVKNFVQQNSFNSAHEYDSKSFGKKKFYELDSQTNRILWFRDIENPTKTKFTELWDAYWDKNYFVNPLDFLNFYKNKKGVQLAFIFGPNGDLWAYHIFVIKKIECCYLITRSYYRHNRFTYKAFSVFDKNKLKDLYSIINRINLTSLETKKAYGYTGYFVDNISRNEFLIDFEKEVIQSKDSAKLHERTPKQEILGLYDFVDKSFHWIKTYGD